MPQIPTIRRPAKKAAAPAAARRRPAPPVDDDEVEEAPRRRSSDADEEARQAAADAAQDGWDGADTMTTDPNWPVAPKVDKGGTFYFKFLQDKPYASVRMHWPEGITQGKRSFMCPQNDCPLCDLGDSPKFEARFNIALLGEGKPALRTLNVAQQQYEDFKAKHLDKRYGPLSSKFYSRTRPSGKGGRWKTEVFKRDSDLEEEIEDLGLNLYIPTDDDLSDFVLWTKADALREINYGELDRVASILAGDYEDDDD